jgi:hypothetical protein
LVWFGLVWFSFLFSLVCFDYFPMLCFKIPFIQMFVFAFVSNIAIEFPTCPITDLPPCSADTLMASLPASFSTEQTQLAAIATAQRESEEAHARLLKACQQMELYKRKLGVLIRNISTEYVNHTNACEPSHDVMKES